MRLWGLLKDYQKEQLFNHFKRNYEAMKGGKR